MESGKGQRRGFLECPNSKQISEVRKSYLFGMECTFSDSIVQFRAITNTIVCYRRYFI